MFFVCNGIILSYSLQLEQFTHEMEDGWGLATDGKILYGSDGTPTLYQIDPQTFKGSPCT